MLGPFGSFLPPFSDFGGNQCQRSLDFCYGFFFFFVNFCWFYAFNDAPFDTGNLCFWFCLRDNLFFLSRCGFDSFELSDKTNSTQALEALSDFSEGYQASVERRLPLFRRRAA